MDSEDEQDEQIGEVFWLRRREQLGDHVMSLGNGEDCDKAFLVSKTLVGGMMEWWELASRRLQ